jgi:hypothetical protein
MLKKLIFLTRPIRYNFDKWSYHKKRKDDALFSLKQKYENTPLLLIGNGPSLRDTPLDNFTNIPSIGLNKIDLLFNKVKWRPQIIICSNNIVIKQHKEKFIKSNIPVYLSWKGRFFLNKKERDQFSYFLSLTSSNFSADITKGVGSAGTVTYTAMQFAYYMGANPVILFGVDHSFSYSGKSNEIQKRQGTDVNHFDPNYFKEGSFWGVPNLELSEYGFHLAKKAFINDGRSIYDATINGQLKIFEKISVNDAKDICKSYK